MILEPAQGTGSAIDVLRLLLGPGSVGIVGQPSAADGLTGFEPVLTGCRSVLVLAGSDVRTSADELPALLAECRRCVGEEGRIAVLARNRAPAVFAALRRRAFGNDDRAIAPRDRRGFVPGMLRAWVRRAGFADALLFAVAPSADEPEELRPFTLADYVAAPAFVVVAGASETPGGILLDHAVQAMEGARSRIGRVTPADVTRLINSSRGKSLAIVERNDIGVVVRVARAPVMREDERVSYRLIEQLQHNAVIRDVVPRPLGEATFGDFAFFAQSRLPGTPLSGWIGDANRSAYVREVELFLRGLNVDLPGRARAAICIPTKSHRPCRPMVEFALGQVADARLRADAAAGLAESLRGARGRLGIVHGDFGTANILVRPSARDGSHRLGGDPVNGPSHPGCVQLSGYGAPKLQRKTSAPSTTYRCSPAVPGPSRKRRSSSGRCSSSAASIPDSSAGSRCYTRSFTSGRSCVSRTQPDREAARAGRAMVRWPLEQHRRRVAGESRQPPSRGPEGHSRPTGP